MNCNCFSEVSAKMCEKLEDPNGTFNAILVIEGNKLVTKPCIEFTYKKKNKDGSRQKMNSTINVAYGFCPFCGNQYEKEENKTNEKED